MNSFLSLGALAGLLALAAPAARAQQIALPPVIVQDKTQPSPRLNPEATNRAERLSDLMVRDLRLNGYQATRLRAINADKTTKLEAAERLNAKNAPVLDQQRTGILHERDQELKAVLSTDQYSNYYDARKRYDKADRDYASTATQVATQALVKSVRDPAPGRANNATIGPANPKATTRPAGNLGRNAR
ncbi:hypothetical protein [Hymenobacter coccineus]|uniref:DUF4142 domain-containing protein n=1 Tax=Hymenobacter coccineus TaxID=1908235 RepID=A0A1G1TIG4_9BACT|nr:hypothetical protein [Hymenobacter coccineus]OGX90664.1 hypothetical protein BEN49_06320 [Hymenobacter coccineus]